MDETGQPCTRQVWLTYDELLRRPDGQEMFAAYQVRRWHIAHTGIRELAWIGCYMWRWHVPACK